MTIAAANITHENLPVAWKLHDGLVSRFDFLLIDGSHPQHDLDVVLQRRGTSRRLHSNVRRVHAVLGESQRKGKHFMNFLDAPSTRQWRRQMNQLIVCRRQSLSSLRHFVSVINVRVIYLWQFGDFHRAIVTFAFVLSVVENNPFVAWPSDHIGRIFPELSTWRINNGDCDIVHKQMKRNGLLVVLFTKYELCLIAMMVCGMEQKKTV